VKITTQTTLSELNEYCKQLRIDSITLERAPLRASAHGGTGDVLAVAVLIDDYHEVKITRRGETVADAIALAFDRVRELRAS